MPSTLRRSTAGGMYHRCLPARPYLPGRRCWLRRTCRAARTSARCGCAPSQPRIILAPTSRSSRARRTTPRCCSISTIGCGCRDKFDHTPPLGLLANGNRESAPAALRGHHPPPNADDHSPFCRRDDCASTRRDNAAGEAGAGVAGRVALVVVHAFMNDDRGAVRVEERIRLAFLKRDRRIQYLDQQLAVLWDMEVRHVPGMTMARQHAVLLIGRIEVWARRCEGGRLAFGGGMDMERMLACRYSFERELD